MQTDLGTIYKLNIHIEGLPSTMLIEDAGCKVSDNVLLIE